MSYTSFSSVVHGGAFVFGNTKFKELRDEHTNIWRYRH